MDLLPLGLKQQGEEGVITTQRQNRHHLEVPSSELRCVDERAGPAGSPSGRELRNTCPAALCQCSVWAPRGEKGPSGVAQTSSLVKSKMDKGKESIMGSKYRLVSTEENFSFPVNTKKSKEVGQC